MEPISIACTTCQTRLRVRDEEALGKILACPRCGAMVQVPAPAVEPSSESKSAPGTASTVAGVASSTPDDSGLDLTLSLEEQRFGRWIWLSLAACGALVLVTLGWLLMPRGEAMPELAQPAEQVAAAPVAEGTPPEQDAAASEDEAAVEETGESDEAGAEAGPAIEAEPSDTRAIDDANHQRTVEALNTFAAEDGAFPVGAAGAAQLPPVERLSWIATLLPYYDHQDWHDALNFRRSWRDAQNREITTQTLAGVVNPAISSAPGEDANTEFPTTHYVGVSGLGADAGDLPVDHPRAGVFGFNRRVRSEDIVDGTSQTIAVLGASGNLGPWSAGGHATVRPLTQAPYVHGPDGFGSGTPDGVAAGMADGSVRFFSKDVDPRVLEQMSTIAGHERALPELPPAGPPQAAVVPSVEPQPAGDEVTATAADTPDDAPGASTTESDEALRAAAAERLGDRLLEIDFAEVSLADFVDFVSQLSTLEITLDLEALAEVGVTPDLKLSIRQTDTSVGEALAAGLAELGLSYSVRGGQLVVSSPRRLDGELREVRYRVADLTGGDRAALEKLADVVRSLVDPATWVDRGGRGTLELVENSLLVRQSDAAHYELLVLCEKLRVARGGAPASGGDPTRFELTSRSEQARAKLDTPITVNYSAGKPLTKIVAFLQDRGHVNLTIDWLALGQTGATREVEAVLAVENVPLGDALDRLLAPLELDYVVMGPHTVQITTRAAAAARRELEFYPVRDLLEEGTSPEAIVARLTEGLVPAGVPGEAAPRVEAHYDAPAACILLLAPQGAQREAEQRLSAWRAERAEAQKPTANDAAGSGANEP